METNPVVSLLSHFSIPERIYECSPSSSGFIHSSYIVSSAGKSVYVLQQFNNEIFKDPQAVYSNFVKVSTYLTAPSYRHFNWITTRDEHAYYQDRESHLWRLLSYVPDSMELKAISSSKDANECGKLLGLFHKQLLPAHAKFFKTPLPDFHDIHVRWKDLENAFQSGIPERIETIKAEIKNLEQLKEYALNIPNDLPLRICHNDTKLSNILFHEKTHEALCFVDLDTIMPGHLYHDFGDLVRTVIAPNSEDAGQVWVQIINRDYLGSLLKGIRASGFQVPEEDIPSLTYGMITLPLLHGIRALTDYVVGDRYYSVSHPEQNRYRAQNLLNFAQACLEIKEGLDQQIRTVLSGTT